MKKSLKRYIVIFQMDCSFQKNTSEYWAVWAKNKKEAKDLANSEKEARKINSENGIIEYLVTAIRPCRKK